MTVNKLDAQIVAILSIIVLGFVGSYVYGQPAPTNASSPSSHDPQHDFDFEFGKWNTKVKRLELPLSGTKKWLDYEGTTNVHKVWNGKAILVELEMDGAAGHFEGASWRMYDPAAHQWSLNFANSRVGKLTPPTVGEFKDGVGEFYDQEDFNGRSILVRFQITHASQNVAHFEQAFSADGGKTWEVNWIADDKRIQSDERID